MEVYFPMALRSLHLELCSLSYSCLSVKRSGLQILFASLWVCFQLFCYLGSVLPLLMLLLLLFLSFPTKFINSSNQSNIQFNHQNTSIIKHYELIFIWKSIEKHNMMHSHQRLDVGCIVQSNRTRIHAGVSFSLLCCVLFSDIHETKINCLINFRCWVQTESELKVCLKRIITAT